MKPIIACTDFSTTANNAVHYAAALASASNAPLILYHHFDYPIPAADFPGFNPAVFVDDAAAGLEARLKDIKRELLRTHEIEIECIVRTFDLQIDLETVFKDEQASLAVLGLQGQSAVLNTLFGSVAAKAIRRGKLPLLLVPEGAVFHSLKKILFPFDDQEIASAAILQPLCDLAISFDAYIEVLTLFDLEKTPALAPNSKMSAPKSALDALLSDTRHGFSYENEAAITNGILYEAARSSADIVAMIPRQHSFLSGLLNQSNTQRIAAAIPVPLLVLEIP